MKVEINADWPKTIGALVAYRFAEDEFRKEIVDGEPTIDAFFMALRLKSAAANLADALAHEYAAKNPSLFKRMKSAIARWTAKD